MHFERHPANEKQPGGPGCVKMRVLLFYPFPAALSAFSFATCAS